MQLPFITFGIDPRGTAVVTSMADQWPHKDRPSRSVHRYLFMDMLDARGLIYVCRFFGLIALRMLRVHHERAISRFDIFLPNPVGKERFNHATIDGNVEPLIPDYGVIRPQHVAAGLSESGLMLAIATREADGSLDAGWRIPFAELHVEGADTASIQVGDVILRRLIELHPDAFSAYPNLSFQPHDQP